MKPNPETPCRKGAEGHEPHVQERRRRLRRAPGLGDRLGSRGGGRGCALMAGGSKKFRRFAVKLHRERVELLTLLATLQSAEPEPGGLPIEHPAEVAAALYNHEETLTLKGWLRQRLAEVDAALQRSRAGTYGRGGGW